MADLIMIAIIVAFCLLCVAYIAWCERIIGPEPTASVTADAGADTERLDDEVTA